MASSRITDPRRLDVAALAAAAGELAGEWPQTGFARLATSTVPGGDAAAPVAWRARGDKAPLTGAGVQPMLGIVADTAVTLECQRCLLPMRLPLHVERRLFFVAGGEDAAAALDAASDEDVLALVPSLDLHAVIEDELLLALPIVPRHEACEMPLPPADAAGLAPVAEEREHPFAVLAALKRSTRPN